MKHRLGFTIVEVIVVITAIAILSGIGAVTYTGLQRQAREDERVADMDVMTSYLETYHEQKGHYPSFRTYYLGTMGGGSDSFLRAEGIPRSALTAPADQAASGPHYSYPSYATASVVNTVYPILGFSNMVNFRNQTQYAYLPFLGAAASGETSSTFCLSQACTRYVLYYKDEQGATQTVRSKYGN